MEPAEYLKKPYGRVVIPEHDGTFRAEIIEFPGCIAVGDTAPEALANLEDVARSWLDVVIAKGQHVPEPIENIGFSGKLVVRLPKSLHKKAVYFAARDGVSLNQFIVSSISEQVGMRTSGLYFGQTLHNLTGIHVHLSSFGSRQLSPPVNFNVSSEFHTALTPPDGGFGVSPTRLALGVEHAGS